MEVVVAATPSGKGGGGSTGGVGRGGGSDGAEDRGTGEGAQQATFHHLL
jgi:hypothetical protein